MLSPTAAATAPATATASSTAAFAVRSAAPAPAARGSLHLPRQLLAAQQPSGRRSASGLAAGVRGRTSGALATAGSISSPSLPSRSSPPSPLSSSSLGARPASSTAAAAAAASSSSGPNSSDPLSEAAKAVSPAAADAAAAAAATLEKPKKKKWAGLARRAASGVALGAGAAATIAWGGWVLCAVACLVVFQASQEYCGLVASLVTSQGEKEREFSCLFLETFLSFFLSFSALSQRKEKLTFCSSPQIIPSSQA